jgi:hypothetical protein
VDKSQRAAQIPAAQVRPPVHLRFSEKPRAGRISPKLQSRYACTRFAWVALNEAKRSVMKMIKPLVLGLALVAGLMAPTMAGGSNAAGLWEIENSEARYEVRYCGNGLELCARLSWVSPEVSDNQNYRNYLGKDVAARLRPVGPSQWRGAVTIDGQTVDGYVRLVDTQELAVTGCKVIFCETVSMYRL